MSLFLILYIYGSEYKRLSCVYYGETSPKSIMKFMCGKTPNLHITLHFPLSVARQLIGDKYVPGYLTLINVKSHLLPAFKELHKRKLTLIHAV